jgi:hypothetical protein
MKNMCSFQVFGGRLRGKRNLVHPSCLSLPDCIVAKCDACLIDFDPGFELLRIIFIPR